MEFGADRANSPATLPDRAATAALFTHAPGTVDRKRDAIDAMTTQVFTSCTNAGPITVYVEDGKIVRIRPLVADESDFRPWTIEAGGRRYSPPKKFNVAPFVLTERDRALFGRPHPHAAQAGRLRSRRRAQSADARQVRLRAASAGTRRSTSSRGEIKRVQTTYGPSAVSAMTSSHHNWGLVGYKISAFQRFFNLIGYTPVLDNPDSWEGWHWGATHTYGFYWRLGMPEPYDMLEDALKHAEMIVYWSNDPDTTRGVYTGYDSAIWRQWLKDKGVKMIFIDPFHNYTAAAMGGKWIAPRPGTDAALALAIAHVWITEGTYDKDYVADRTVGFDDFKRLRARARRRHAEDAALGGRGDAACRRAPSWRWRANGRASAPMLAAGARGGEGGACRQAYGTEWARLMVLLQAMQGLGKPGIGIWGTAMGAPRNNDVWFPAYGDPEGRHRPLQGGAPAAGKSGAATPLPADRARRRSSTPPISWKGEGFCNRSLEQQFTPFTYPMPGCSEVKLWYRYGGSFPGTMTDTSKWARMYQSPKLEFVVNQDCWWSARDRLRRHHPARLHPARARRHRRMGRARRPVPRAAAAAAISASSCA